MRCSSVHQYNMPSRGVQTLNQGVPRSEAKIVCFVVGCPRSGTTLLSVMLDRHPELAIPPETAFYDDIAPHLARFTRRKEIHELLAGWRRFPELGLNADRVLERCVEVPTSAELLGLLLRLYAQNRSKLLSGEKTPQHLRHVPRILQDFPQASVLCLVRDGRDVALSLSSMPWSSADLSAASQTWLEAVRLSNRMATTYPKRFLEVRYEHLVTHPEKALRAIMGFLGLDFQPAQLCPDNPSGVILARSLEWKGRALGPVDGTRVSRWRSTAEVDQIHFLNKVLGTELDRLGYSAA